MNIKNFKDMKRLFLLLGGAALLWSCGSSSKGELTGVTDRPVFEDMDLAGMIFVDQGNFIMGGGNQDNIYGVTTPERTVQVVSFFMDETEITNNEYRQFVYYVRDSIARRLLGEAGVEGYLIEEDQYGEPIEPALLDNRTRINWDEQESREALEPMYLAEKDRFYRKRDIDPAKLNYEYYWIDYQAASKKEKEGVSNKGELKGSMFANRPKGLNNRSQFIKKEVVNVYPDTLCWMHDYTYSNNEDFTRQYFTSPAYDNYPVVGVSWVQAKAFCVWRSQYLNNHLANIGYAQMCDFRLPSEAEWEWAARGGMSNMSYPWGGPYIRNGNGCFLANYQPLRGAFDDDGGVKTLMVGHYAPNDFGLYDMSGNVAEWCEDAYNESMYTVGNNLAMSYQYNANDEDDKAMKRKVVRGGSWKDQKYYIQVQTRTYEYQDTAKSYIGFRCVQSYLGRVKGDNLKSASNVY